jgi:hypothetical protein
MYMATVALVAAMLYSAEGLATSSFELDIRCIPGEIIPVHIPGMAVRCRQQSDLN